MLLDTGAIRTRALPLLANDFPAFAHGGVKGQTRVTGVAGSVDVNTVTIPELPLRIDRFDLLLRQTEMLLNDTASDHRLWHIWSGIDLAGQARGATLDFRSMTFTLE